MSKSSYNRPAPYLTQQEIGARIGALRDERGVSQRALAEALNLDPSAMSRVESGARGLAVDELVAIAGFFGVPVAGRLGGDITPAPFFRNEGGAVEGGTPLRASEPISATSSVSEAVPETY